jgi:2-methylcitrate dehydratase PrpD
LETADGGFCRATSDQVDLSLATAELGAKFLSGETNIKPYACCASAHSAIDGVFELKAKHWFLPSDVEKVVVKASGVVQVQCGFPYKAVGVVEAQMSLQFIVAVALLEGAALLEQFSEAKIKDPGVFDLARRVEIVVDSDMDALYPARYANKVEVILKNGQRFETRIDFPRGSVERPMTFTEVAEKFRSLASHAVTTERAEQIIETVDKLETLDNIQQLTRLLG